MHRSTWNRLVFTMREAQREGVGRTFRTGGGGSRSSLHCKEEGGRRPVRIRWTFGWLLSLLLVVACGTPVASPGGPRPDHAGVPQAGQAAGQPRTLTIAVRYEPNNLAPKASAGIPAVPTQRLFTASLALLDSEGRDHPYLAEALPQLNTDTWRVAPDGAMETTFKLRPNLTWHDGHPLTADDFVFAYAAYTAPGIGLFASNPQSLMRAVEAPDPSTVVIRWSRPYPEAASLRPGDFEPLPRHIPEAPLRDEPAESFTNHPYWTREFISAGPYRVDRWEPGSHVEGSAFAGHVLGRPKIDRILIKFIGDENTVLTNLLSNAIDMSMEFTLRYEHVTVLKREWIPSGKGVALPNPQTIHYAIAQFRPEYANPRSILDLRVRKAMAHAIDRRAINDGLFEGEGAMSETYVLPSAPYFAAVDRAITKYPYDVRRTEQLMNEAGFTKDSSGAFANAAGERYAPEFWVEQGSQFERELAIITKTWTDAGIPVQPYVLPAVQVRNNQVRATFPAFSTPSTGGGERAFRIFTTADIGGPHNLWAGSNRGGWSNPEYDAIYDAFNTTLARPERERQMVEMMRIVSEQLPAFMLYHNVYVIAHRAELTGPARYIPDSLPTWNVHTWELR